MFYFLSLPQLGYSKKVESSTLSYLKVIAEVRLEHDLYRVDDNLLFLRENGNNLLLIEALGLLELEYDVQYEWYQGETISDYLISFKKRLFVIPLFESASPIGSYKKQLFCNENIKLAIEKTNCNSHFIEVEDGDIRNFIWTGKHLDNYSLKIKETLLRGLHNNWDSID